MALIGSRTRHRVCPSTRTCLACIRLRTEVAVVAYGAVIGIRIRTHARHWIARARDVALIRRSASNCRARGAHAHLTRIHWRTRVAIATGRAIRNIGMARRARCTHFGGAGIAIIERQIGIVRNIDESAIAIANMEQTVVIGLRRDRRILRREGHTAHAIGVTRALAAFIVRSRTIRRRVATDAFRHVVTHERITIAIHSAIGALRYGRV